MLSKIQLRALVAGLLVLAILSLFFYLMESGYFWQRVVEVRMLTGANSSFEVAEKVAREPKMVLMGLLAICIKYAIASYIVLGGIRDFILTNAIVFGLVAVALANIINAFLNIRAIADYPWITLLEVMVALVVCTVIGYFMQLRVKKANEAT